MFRKKKAEDGSIWLVGALCGLIVLGGSNPQLVKKVSAGIREIPIVNLARAYREWNWGGGSCVHASNVMALRWCNELAVAKWWRETYAGGESFNGLTSKLQRAKIKFYATHTGDVSVLERAVNERRAVVIFYYENHSILLVHLDATQAVVLDNNRIDKFISIPRETFIRNWKGYGGVGIVPQIGAPRPPLPWIASR